MLDKMEYYTIAFEFFFHLMSWTTKNIYNKSSGNISSNIFHLVFLKSDFTNSLFLLTLICDFVTSRFHGMSFADFIIVNYLNVLRGSLYVVEKKLENRILTPLLIS